MRPIECSVREMPVQEMRVTTGGQTYCPCAIGGLCLASAVWEAIKSIAASAPASSYSYAKVGY